MNNYINNNDYQTQKINLPNNSDNTVWVGEKSPEERVLTHPLFGEPAIRTLPSVEAYLACKNRMLSGVGGFSLLGVRGAGRRGALKVMRAYLSQEFPSLSVIEYLLPQSSPSTSCAVLHDLLASAGISVTGGARSAQFQRLMNMQQERALVSGIPRCVVFLYNAEYMNEVICKTLLDVRDGLQLRGIRLFTISGALFDKFISRISSLRNRLGDDALGSLFGSVYQLRELSGVEDYGAVLTEIDTLLMSDPYPVTWTEALLPQAYGGGFRLASQADALHAAVESQTLTGRLPVRSLFGVVSQVLSLAVHLDAPEFEIPLNVWADAVRVVMGVGAAYLPSPSS
ncbi:hypothetical protein [Burkholderia cepacia]|uniref:hypothetical protein n=1 Tax=Burkholderia cepacia TaxID=292 RepID=UPI002AB707FD|nr:hypothetical protein [Burkholderia cepacia]